MQDSRRFYTELGNLFYAVAAADKKIRPEERDALHDEIRYAWKHYDDSTDRYGSDRAYLIEFEFDTMEDLSETPDKAFESFVSYFRENERMLDEATKIRIFNSARHIAESVRKINTAELDYLVQLKKLLKV